MNKWVSLNLAVGAQVIVCAQCYVFLPLTCVSCHLLVSASLRLSYLSVTKLWIVFDLMTKSIAKQTII